MAALPRLLLPAVLLALLALLPHPSHAQCVPGVYTLTIDYLFVRSKDPSAPLSSHLSPITAFSHSRRFSSFVPYGYATPGVKLVAETGDNSVLQRELRSPLVKTVRTTATAHFDGDPISLEIPVGCNNPFISILSMIAPSPDWIIALFPTDMRGPDGKFLPSLAGDMLAWDAGTDAGATLTAVDKVSNPVQNIAPLVGAPFDGKPVATYTLILKGAPAPAAPLAAPAPVSVPSPRPAGARCRSARYSLTVRNMWAKPRFNSVPTGAMLSPLTAVSHSRRFSALTLFGYASEGVQLIAETGDNSVLIKELGGPMAKPFVKDVVAADAPTLPNMRTRIVLQVDCMSSVVSFLQMLAPSPDWIIGKANMDTMKNGRFVKKIAGGLKVYDAGTDSGRSLLAKDKKTTPRQNIAPLVGPPFDGKVIARFVLKRL